MLRILGCNNKYKKIIKNLTKKLDRPVVFERVKWSNKMKNKINCY